MTSERQTIALTVDLVLFLWNGEALSVALVRRGVPPFEGLWALPGGFVEPHETLEEAARRELREEASLEPGAVLQCPVANAVDRDPRGRTVSVPYVAVESNRALDAHGGSDAADARFWPLAGLPWPLAFDHDLMLAAARRVALEGLRRGFLRAILPEEECAQAARALEGEG